VSVTRRNDLLALTILSSVLLLFFADVLVGTRAFYVRDLAFYYYPAKHVLREIVLAGEFPYWNPFFAAGQPLAANPEHEVFYPLTWLVLLPGYDLGFRLLVLLHLHIAGWTMYALLRSMRASVHAGFLGALSFCLGGLVLSCISLLPILFSLAWLPLTCLFTRRFLLERQRRDFVFAALSFGLQMLVGEPATIVQTGLLLAAYALARCLRERGARPLLRMVLIALAAAGVGAVTLLPAIDHARDSVRGAGFELDVVTKWSMPASRLAELALPHFASKAELPFYLSLYPGLLILALALAGLARRIRGAWLFAAIFAGAFLLALGSHTPLWRWLYDAGLARSVRYPEKFMLLAVFALIVFGARAADHVAAFRRPLWVALAALFVLVDLGRLVPEVSPRIESRYLTEPPLLAQRLPGKRSDWRFLHVVQWQNDGEFRAFETGPDHYWMRRNALRPAMPARWGLRTVMEVDYDKTSLQATEDFVATAWWLAHVRPDWAEIVAPMANARFLGSYDDPRRAFARTKNRRDVQPVRVTPLGDNPRYFFASQVVPVRDLRDFATKLAGAKSTRGVAFVADRAGVPATARGVVRGVSETANSARIDVETQGRAFLVMSVTPHKYWEVTIDGAPAEPMRVNAGFQGVVVPTAGRHVVEMRYRNPLIAAGGALSLASIMAMAFITMRRQ